MRPAIPILSFLLLVGCEWSEKSSADRKANTATIPPEQGNVAAQANDDGAPMVAQSAREGGGSKEIDKTSRRTYSEGQMEPGLRREELGNQAENAEVHRTGAHSAGQ